MGTRTVRAKTKIMVEVEAEFNIDTSQTISTIEELARSEIKILIEEAEMACSDAKIVGNIDISYVFRGE